MLERVWFYNREKGVLHGCVAADAPASEVTRAAVIEEAPAERDWQVVDAATAPCPYSPTRKHVVLEVAR